MAPAHPHATSVAVYLALLLIHLFVPSLSPGGVSGTSLSPYSPRSPRSPRLSSRDPSSGGTGDSVDLPPHLNESGNGNVDILMDGIT